MNTCKLIFRNVCKNIRDYLIYFLTLTLSVSLFYAFNSISDQPAFSNMGMTGTLLYRQLGIMLSTLSTMIAVVLAFLILYANQFLLKRRKKELGVYMMLGMKKGRISRLFAGETLCVGIIALGTGLLLGFFFSQGFSLIALRLFAINLEKFRIVFSAGALRQTVLCFTIIFFIVMLFNIRSVTNVQLIDLFTDGRKNESMQTENRILPVCLFLLSLLCIGISAALFNKNGILPSHENNLFQLAAAALVAVLLAVSRFHASSKCKEMLLPERSEYVPCPSGWQQNPNQLSCGNGCMRIADHHDLRRVDWREHSACYEQNVSICNAL